MHQAHISQLYPFHQFSTCVLQKACQHLIPHKHWEIPFQSFTQINASATAHWGIYLGKCKKDPFTDNHYIILMFHFIESFFFILFKQIETHIKAGFFLRRKCTKLRMQSFVLICLDYPLPLFVKQVKSPCNMLF